MKNWCYKPLSDLQQNNVKYENWSISDCLGTRYPHKNVYERK